MAASTLIPVEEYLKTVYRPDCDYVDGVVEERNLGEKDHSWIQRNLIVFFGRGFRGTGITAMPEWRLQVTPTRFRIPDITIIAGTPDEAIQTRPPLLCIEVLSPEDRLTRVNARVREYLDFGVPAVWVVDPATRTIWIYRRNGVEESTGDSIKLDGTSVEVPLSEIFD